jgi:hypothetical protein
MLKLVASKAAWVGRTASAAFGLALVVVSVLVVAEAAFGNDGDFFKVGRTNLASAVSVLSKSGTGPALNLQVGSGAPLAVNSSSKVVKLNADKLDGKDADAFAQANGTLPAVRALGTAQTIDTSGGSLLQLPNEDFDQVGTGQSGQLHTTATNNSRFTAPRAGIYRVDAQVGWSLNSSGTTSGIRGAYFKKNNNGSCNDGVVATVNAFDRVDAQEGGQTFNHLGTLLALNRGDYVEVCVYQSDGAPLSIYPHGTFVEMHYVSPR